MSVFEVRDDIRVLLSLSTCRVPHSLPSSGDKAEPNLWWASPCSRCLVGTEVRQVSTLQKPREGDGEFVPIAPEVSAGGNFCPLPGKSGNVWNHFYLSHWGMLLASRE